MGGAKKLVSSVAETVTGGAIKSESTKDKIRKAEKAAKEQKRLLAEQKAELAKEEATRKERIKRARQGRRALLYKEGDETGVGKATTLGG